jgi:hypothetical protein
MHAPRGFARDGLRPCVWLCRASGQCPYTDPSVLTDLEPYEAQAVLACLHQVYLTGVPLCPDAGEDEPELAPRDPRQVCLF